MIVEARRTVYTVHLRGMKGMVCLLYRKCCKSKRGSREIRIPSENVWVITFSFWHVKSSSLRPRGRLHFQKETLLLSLLYQGNLSRAVFPSRISDQFHYTKAKRELRNPEEKGHLSKSRCHKWQKMEENSIAI